MSLHTLFLIFVMCITLSCHQPPDLETEKKEILSLHDQQRQAHFEKNPELLMGESLGDFMEVNRGIIKKPTREESRARLQAYFDSVEFIKWDDISPPVISFSDDATMATSVVDKLVIIRDIKTNQIDTTHFAWIAVYKKDKGKWKMHRVVSTNR